MDALFFQLACVPRTISMVFGASYEVECGIAACKCGRPSVETTMARRSTKSRLAGPASTQGKPNPNRVLVFRSTTLWARAVGIPQVIAGSRSARHFSYRQVSEGISDSDGWDGNRPGCPMVACRTQMNVTRFRPGSHTDCATIATAVRNAHHRPVPLSTAFFTWSSFDYFPRFARYFSAPLCDILCHRLRYHTTTRSALLKFLPCEKNRANPERGRSRIAAATWTTSRIRRG
jgi:hypothetical protein